jgi:hypothetical protein
VSKTNRTSGDGKPLDEKELDRVTGGMDVEIGQVNASVSTVGGSSIMSGAVLGAVVKSVVEGAKNKDRPS